MVHDYNKLEMIQSGSESYTQEVEFEQKVYWEMFLQVIQGLKSMKWYMSIAAWKELPPLICSHHLDLYNIIDIDKTYLLTFLTVQKLKYHYVQQGEIITCTHIRKTMTDFYK